MFSTEKLKSPDEVPELRNVAGSFYREMEKLANTMHEPLVLSSWMYSFELAAFTDINKPEINMQINMNYIRAINPRLPLKQVLNQIWKTSHYQEKLSICSISCNLCGRATCCLAPIFRLFALALGISKDTPLTVVLFRLRKNVVGTWNFCRTSSSQSQACANLACTLDEQSCWGSYSCLFTTCIWTCLGWGSVKIWSNDIPTSSKRSNAVT